MPLSVIVVGCYDFWVWRLEKYIENFVHLWRNIREIIERFEGKYLHKDLIWSWIYDIYWYFEEVLETFLWKIEFFHSICVSNFVWVCKLFFKSQAVSNLLEFNEAIVCLPTLLAYSVSTTLSLNNLKFRIKSLKIQHKKKSESFSKLSFIPFKNYVKHKFPPYHKSIRWMWQQF